MNCHGQHMPYEMISKKSQVVIYQRMNKVQPVMIIIILSLPISARFDQLHSAQRDALTLMQYTLRSIPRTPYVNAPRSIESILIENLLCVCHCLSLSVACLLLNSVQIWKRRFVQRPALQLKLEEVNSLSGLYTPLLF